MTTPKLGFSVQLLGGFVARRRRHNSQVGRKCEMTYTCAMKRPREAPPLTDLFVHLGAEPDQAMERLRRIAEARIGVAPGGKYHH